MVLPTPSPWFSVIYPPDLAVTAPPEAQPTPTPTRSLVYAPPATGPVLPLDADALTTRLVPTLAGATRILSFGGDAGAAPNATEWTYDTSAPRASDLQSYTAATANGWVDGGGHLVVTALREPTSGSDGTVHPFSSARLTTAGKVVIAPGSYVEASITAPTGLGAAPGFSTVAVDPAQPAWPRSVGADVFEGAGAVPTVAHSALHMMSLSNSRVDNMWGWGRPGGTTDVGTPLNAGPHLYGIYFDANSVQIYIDRRLTMKYAAAEAAATDRAWPFGGPQYLALNVAVRTGTPATTDVPLSMIVGPIGIFSGMPF